MRKLTRLSGTFFFFPALLPLAELVPWLLTVLGVVTAAADMSSRSFWQIHRRKLHVVFALSVVATAGYYLYTLPVKEVRDTGTRLIAAENQPVAVQHRPAPEFAVTEETQFKPLWSVKVEKQILSSPIVAGNLLVYGTYSNTVEAVSLADGQPVWSLPLAAPVFTMKLGHDGRIYAGEGLHDDNASNLTVIEPASGKVLWQRQFLGHLEEESRLSPDNTRLYLGAGPSGLWAVDTRDGRLLWHQPLGHIDSCPLLLDDTLYIAAQISETEHRSRFFALSAESGKTQWQLDQPGQPWGSPLVDKSGRILLTSTGEGQIGVSRSTDRGWAYGLSRDGKTLWQTELPDMPIQPSLYLAEEDLIIHAVKSGEVVALHAADGTLAWKFKVGGTLQAPATLISGPAIPLIAVTSYEGTFSLHDARNGATLAVQRVGPNSTSAPVAQGDRVYVASSYALQIFGGLHALAAARKAAEP
jgi:outer membrane protein assembly factor BamB